MKKILILSLIMVLVLTGCGAKNSSSSNTNNDKSESANEELNTEEESDEKVEPGMELFAELPKSFYFSSGAGAWGTELHLNEDGTFYGAYSDSDMGTTGEGYPNGTQYISNFSGKFTAPQQVSEYVYSTTIEYITVEREGEEYIEEGVRYVVSEPYGLTNAGEFMIYMYGIPNSELPAEFISWMQGLALGPDNLNCYGIYNVNEQSGFSGFKYEAYEELLKLGGEYVNEAGDRVVIYIDDTFDEYVYEMGRIDWIPHDGVQETGAIRKNAKGGFTFCLEDSVQYNFEMTNYEEGKIQFVGADKWSEGFGTFSMQ